VANNENNSKEFLASEKKSEEQIDRLFDSIAGVQLDVSKGFGDRVLKEWGKRKPPARSRHWGYYAVPALIAVVLVLTHRFSGQAFEAGVQQQVAIRLDIRSHVKEAQCNVRVQLPEGVHFYSKTNPEVQASSSLELPCDAQTASGTLPIVLEGTEEGIKKVSVRFLDPAQQEISRADFNIRFRKGSVQT